MASVSVFCILCAASLRKTGNRRQLFSASSQPIVPLLTTYASLICGHDRGLTTTSVDWVLSFLCHRKSKALVKSSSKGFCHYLWAAIQKRRDREGNVSLPFVAHTVHFLSARASLHAYYIRKEEYKKAHAAYVSLVRQWRPELCDLAAAASNQSKTTIDGSTVCVSALTQQSIGSCRYQMMVGVASIASMRPFHLTVALSRWANRFSIRHYALTLPPQV